MRGLKSLETGNHGSPLPITFPTGRPARPILTMAADSTLIPKLPSYCQRRNAVLGGCSEAKQAKIPITDKTTVERANEALDATVLANRIFVVCARLYAPQCAGMEVRVDPFRHDRVGLTDEMRATLLEDPKAPFFKLRVDAAMLAMQKVGDVVTIVGDAGTELSLVVVGFHSLDAPMPATVVSRISSEYDGAACIIPVYGNDQAVTYILCQTAEGKPETAMLCSLHGKKAFRTNVLNGVRLIRAGPDEHIALDGQADTLPVCVTNPDDAMCGFNASLAFSTAAVRDGAQQHRVKSTSTAGTTIFIFLMGEAYDSLRCPWMSDIDRVARLHIALGFIKAITAEAHQACPALGQSITDHTFAAITRKNFQLMVQGSISLDLGWKRAFGEIRRHSDCDANAWIERHFGGIEQHAASRSVQDVLDQHMLNLVHNTWIADGSIADIKKRHGYSNAREKKVTAPPASAPALLYAALYEADRILEVLLTKYFKFSLKDLTARRQTQATLITDHRNMVRINTEPSCDAVGSAWDRDVDLHLEVDVAEDIEGFVANQQIDFNAAVERDRIIDENIGLDAALPAPAMPEEGDASTEAPTRSLYLQDLEDAMASAQDTGAFLDSLATLREKTDVSGHTDFRGNSNVLSEAQMAQRNRKVVLDAVAACLLSNVLS